MKTSRYIVYFGIMFLILSCGEDKPSTNLKQIQNKQIKDIESRSDSRYVEDIFLNLKFGDSEDVVSDKLEQLLSQGEVFLDDKRRYTYKFNFDIDISEVFSRFQMKYHNDELYKLTLIVEENKPDYLDYLSNKETLIDLGTEIIHSNLTMLYLDKYSSNYQYEISKERGLINPEYPDRYYIDGNLQIKISLDIDKVYVEYLDLFMDKQIKKNEEIKKDQDIKKTKSDI